MKRNFEAPLVIFESPRKPIDVVGGTSHQVTLERVAGGCDENGPRVRDHTVVLMPEPSNVDDARAVRVVMAAGGTVGYLSHWDAEAYRPIIDRLALIGKFAACRGFIFGEGGRLGVRLFMDTPEDTTAALDADSVSLTPAWASVNPHVDDSMWKGGS